MQVPAVHCHNSLEHSRTSPFHPCALWQSQVIHLWSDHMALCMSLEMEKLTARVASPTETEKQTARGIGERFI